MTTTSNWSNAVAHIDADAFYASCEAVRHPEFRNRPVCVLSNQNAMVIAKSYSAKALGIKTGTPVWEARKMAPTAVFLSPDFRYYGQMSQKMFSVLNRYSPEIEVYSIDEGFMDLNGLRTLWKKSFMGIADEIRDTIKQEVGITVSVGVSNTKTLAKMASELNKPNGTTIIPGKRVDRFLADIPVGDIPGIGRNRIHLLHKFNIRSALQFAEADEGLMRRLLGRHGLVLRDELRGKPVLPIETVAPIPKSIARTASMGLVTSDRQIITGNLASHTMRLVSELTAKHLLTHRIQVFLTRKSFETTATEVRFEYPTNSWKRISAAVHGAVDKLYRAGELYRGCGVVAGHISSEASTTEDLFGSMRQDLQQAQLFVAVNNINRRYGGKAITSASAGATIAATSPRFKYPIFKAS